MNDHTQTRIDWQTDPVSWIANHRETLIGDVDNILSEYSTTDPVAIIKLLAAVQDSLGYAIRRNHEWIGYGPIAVPASSVGLEVLRQLRDVGRSMSTGAFAFVDAESKLGRLLDAIRASKEGSAIVGGAQNVTHADDRPEMQGVRVNVDLDPSSMNAMPKGERLPSALLSASLVGKDIDGDNVAAICESAGLCLSGVTQFLSRFGISHEGGDHDCEYCGATTESDEGEVSWCESFTLTEDMVSALDSEGYLEAVREYFDDDDAAEDWETLLADPDELVLSFLLPDDDAEKAGIKYDPEVWTFVPDFEALAGLEDLDFAQLSRILPILSTVVAAYAARKILPPVPGRIVRSKGRYCRPGDNGFQWDPTEGTFCHGLTSAGVTVKVNARHGSITLILGRGDRERVGVDRDEARFLVRVGGSHNIGTMADLYVRLAQGSVNL